MDIQYWIITLLLFSTLHGICTWKMYQAAGQATWKAFTPVINAITILEIVERPKWWAFFLFIPVINLLIFPVLWIEILRTFGKKSTTDMLLGVATLGLYIGYVNYTQPLNYESERNLKAPNKVMENLGSISFAIIFATLVHTYFIQPFVIPTSSLEKSLLVGDFLLVSKFHYGARTPITPIAAPMVHDTLPIIKTKSYSSWPELPYFRFPKLQSVERNEIVVFNWPVDTVAKFFDTSGKSYYKPIDKKSNYVKRCTGIPGDVLEIKKGDLYINGKISELPTRSKVQYAYRIIIDKKDPNTLVNLEKALIESSCTDGMGANAAQDTIIARAMTEPSAMALKNITGVTKVERLLATTPEKAIFPHTKNWNVDNLGPIKIPHAGETVQLNSETVPFYKRIISVYEKNQLSISGDDIRINGKPAKTYTFKQDYYWMMGDNRHNSEDSRYWGFVPADHIVGKPIFIWMSFDINNVFQKPFLDRFRPSRMFTTVSGEGEPQSYLHYFLVCLALYLGWDYYNKKKKAKKE